MKITVLAFGLILVSCAAALNNFRVIGTSGDISASVSSGTPSDFANEIYEAIKSYGFENQGLTPDGTYFTFYLSSKSERIDIAVKNQIVPWITLKDYRSFSESSFDQSVLNSIVDRIKQRYNLRIEFKRVSDIFS